MLTEEDVEAMMKLVEFQGMTREEILAEFDKTIRDMHTALIKEMNNETNETLN